MFGGRVLRGPRRRLRCPVSSQAGLSLVPTQPQPAVDPWRLLLEYRIPGVPQAKQRARAGIRGKRAHLYQDSKHPSEAYAVLVSTYVRIRMRARGVEKIPKDTPVRVDIDFVYPRRRSQFRAKDPDTRIHKATKPDRDNLEKLQLDAMTDAELWADDGVVCAGAVRKWWGAIVDRKGKRSEAPHALVRVFLLGAP